MGEGKELRVGVVIVAGRVPAWASRCLAALAGEPGVRLAAVFHPESLAAQRPVRGPWALAERALRRRSAALRRVDPPHVLDQLPVATVGGVSADPPGVTRPADAVPTGPDDASATAGMAGPVAPPLDVLVDLVGVESPTDSLVGLARHGLWRFAFGPERLGAASAVGLADVLDGRPTAEIELLADIGGECPIVLRQGSIRTIAHSWRRHRDHLLLHAVDWPALTCRDTLVGRSAGRAAPPTAAATPTRISRARLARRMLVAKGTRAIRLLQEEQWHVGVVDVAIDAFLRPGDLPPPTWLPGPPRRGSYADPFPCPGGRVIVEWFGLRQRVGSLCVLDPKPSGRLPQPVAQPGHHISYPYVLEHVGQAYCTPETADLGEVGLYRLVGEPPTLEKVTTLVRGVAAVDPTVTFHDGHWWLFFTDRDRDADTDLHAWHAADLFGPWQAHRRNPVKVDVRSSRPAGTPFTCEGTLFRPAMDNAGSYGGRIVVNRVVELTPDDFAEEVAAVVPPFPGAFGRGIHTMAAAGRSTLIDGKRLRVVPSVLPTKLWAHWRRCPAASS